MPAPFSTDPTGRTGLPGGTRPYIELTGVGKSFGGVPVLSDITMTIARGSVHGLVGENGAGKSSLSKIIAGLLPMDRGQMKVDGESVAFHSPREALSHGIAMIAQELALVPSLSVAENVFLGSEPRRSGFIQRGSLKARFAALAAEAGFDLRGDERTGSLRLADQQKVEILRALSRGAEMIIMDEPTAALSRRDTRQLHEIVRSLARSGHTVLLISHFLSEVLELTDTVTILRDGRIVRAGPSAQETDATLIESMLGHSLGSVFPDKIPPAETAPVVLRVEDLTAPGVNRVSLSVRAGEIVGLAGLVGAGRSELAHAIFGGTRVTSGSITIDGAPLKRGTPSRALRKGIFLVPESRKDQGLLLRRPIFENVTLADLARLSIGGWVKARRERVEADTMTGEVTVAGGGVKSIVAALSGGNQQKVMFARGLMHHPRVLIADEPTRGVDVGSRRAIYELLVDKARQGIAVLVISSDIEEVLGLAHRVVVIRRGRVSAELTADAMNEENILTAAFSEAGEERKVLE